MNEKLLKAALSSFRIQHLRMELYMKLAAVDLSLRRISWRALTF